MTGTAIATNHSNVPAIHIIMKALVNKQFAITLHFDFSLRCVWRLVKVFLTVWALPFFFFFLKGEFLHMVWRGVPFQSEVIWLIILIISNLYPVIVYCKVFKASWLFDCLITIINLILCKFYVIDDHSFISANKRELVLLLSLYPYWKSTPGQHYYLTLMTSTKTKWVYATFKTFLFLFVCFKLAWRLPANIVVRASVVRNFIWWECRQNTSSKTIISVDTV